MGECKPGDSRRADVAWAAGIVEGEGSLHSQTSRFKGTDREYVYPRISISMSDKDILDRLHGVLGVGRVKPLTSPSRPAHHRPMWTLNVDAYADVIATLRLLLPWFGERRRAKAEELLTMAAGRVGPGGRPFGWDNHATKVSADQVNEIRGLRGTLSQEAIANRFGISRSQVGRIIRGTSRQSVRP